MATINAFALPYPTGLNVKVFRDDGNWDRYEKWFMRPAYQINELHVASYTLAHYEGEDEPCYSASEWAVKSAQLVERHPGCVFVY